MGKRIGYIVLYALLMASCRPTILEIPENGGIDPTLVNLELLLSTEPVEPYTSANTPSGDASEMPYDVRWIIEVYRDGLPGDLVERRILAGEPASDGVHSIQTTFALHAAKYHAVAWVDYVDAGLVADKYYEVDTLSSIRIPDSEHYVGNEAYKDAYAGNQVFDLSAYRDIWNAETSSAMKVTPAVAKIEFIATDVDKFLGQTAPSGNSNLLAGDGASPGDLDVASLQITVQYAGYFPSSYNAYTGKPNDASLGVSFDCCATPLSDTEARLAGDHVFVNGSESAVTVNLLVRDNRGNLLNEVAGIRVPVVSGKLTTIRGEFLTKKISSGIGINPNFEGEYNIVIPD